MSKYKKCRSVVFYLCLILVVEMAASQESVPQDYARFDYARIYNVDIDTEEHVKLLQTLEAESDSLDFIGHAREVGQKLSILVSPTKVADFADLLTTYNITHRVLNYDFQAKIDRSYNEVLPIGTNVSKFDWLHFFHLDTIYEWLDEQVKAHPDVLTLLDIGTSTQGMPIKGVKLSHNPNNKAIFIESGIHAREWIAPATATYILNELLNSNDTAVQELAKNYNWFIFPSVNPDGYKFTFEHNRMWRKNRQLFYTTRGVDLNRNFPHDWNTIGSSSIPSRFDYAGPSAASELETQRLVNWLRENRISQRITAFISLHSYSQMIMFPYGSTKERVPNYEDLNEFAIRAAARIKDISGKVYTTGSIIETIYPSSGGSMDWAYSEGVPIAYTFELRGTPDSQDMFILAADEILPTATEAFGAIQEIVLAATEKGYFKESAEEKAVFY